jgi:hypothetical protein
LPPPAPLELAELLPLELAELAEELDVVELAALELDVVELAALELDVVELAAPPPPPLPLDPACCDVVPEHAPIAAMAKGIIAKRKRMGTSVCEVLANIFVVQQVCC